MALRRLYLGIITALIAGCATTPYHEFDSSVNFAGWKSFEWRSPEHFGEKVNDPILDSALLSQRMETAINGSLTARGYNSNAENPDFIVTYHAAKDLDIDNSGPTFSFGIYRGWSHLNTGMLFDNRPRIREQGVLIIDVIDARTEKLAWRGWREVPLTQDYFRGEKVIETVQNILSAFPPEQDAGNTR
jgi:hypothetical protein